MKRLSSCCLLLFFLAACQREAPPPQPPTEPAGPATPAALAAAPAAVELKDVIERDPRYLIGISYPKGIDRYPGLAAELQRYADAARKDIDQAVAALGAQKPGAPYDLSLNFSTVVDTPRIVAVAAEGSSYTGGAHGNPLVARFVWLPQQQKMLTARDLIPDRRGWRDISDYAREQLHAALSQRLDADEMAPADRAQLMKSALKMIDQGTAPEAASFGQFEPVLGPDGKLVVLRFVFPPYQVGPYSDGEQTAEVPASVLLPHVAPQYRDLFTSQ